jgi:hypothetical protein
MSAFRDPVGPQPGRVYWRRRLIALAGVLAVVVVIALIVFRPPADPVPAASQSSAPVQAGGASTAAEAPPSGEPVACTADQVVVTAVTDADTYDADVEPQLSWTLANPSAVPCTINVGTSQQVFTITSGDEVIWTSTDCQSDATDFPLTLEPGGEPASSASIPWSRERSSADTCSADAAREKVTAGGASYHLQVSVGGIASADTKQFILN